MLSYMERKKEELETSFIRSAHAAITDGLGYPEFSEKHPEYGQIDRSGFTRLWIEMSNRHKQAKQRREPWTADGELALSRERWAQMQMKRTDDAIYQQHRAELLKLASEGAGWLEAKRRLDWLDDSEPLYRRAQQEAGVSRRNERQDPMDAAFASGFFSE